MLSTVHFIHTLTNKVIELQKGQSFPVQMQCWLFPAAGFIIMLNSIILYYRHVPETEVTCICLQFTNFPPEPFLLAIVKTSICQSSSTGSNCRIVCSFARGFVSEFFKCLGECHLFLMT